MSLVTSAVLTAPFLVPCATSLLVSLGYVGSFLGVLHQVLRARTPVPTARMAATTVVKIAFIVLSLRLDETARKESGIGQWLTHARAGGPSFLGLIGFAPIPIAAVARDNVVEVVVVVTPKTCTRTFAVSET